MIVTLTGPTCAGKSTVERELQAMGYGRAISHTTRTPREGETNGDAYHFVTPEEFELLDAQDAFVEKIDFGPKKYGMSKDEIHRCHRAYMDTAIVVDPHGADQIRRYCRKANIPVASIWIDCGEQEQARRWISRTAEEVAKKNDAAVQPAIERLAIMMTEEMRWRSAAMGGTITRDGGEQYTAFYSSLHRSAKDIADAIHSRLHRREEQAFQSVRAG